MSTSLDCDPFSPGLKLLGWDPDNYTGRATSKSPVSLRGVPTICRPRFPSTSLLKEEQCHRATHSVVTQGQGVPKESIIYRLLPALRKLPDTPLCLYSAYYLALLPGDLQCTGTFLTRGTSPLPLPIASRVPMERLATSGGKATTITHPVGLQVAPLALTRGEPLAW